jgi:hypothetical protein
MPCADASLLAPPILFENDAQARLLVQGDLMTDLAGTTEGWQAEYSFGPRYTPTLLRCEGRSVRLDRAPQRGAAFALTSASAGKPRVAQPMQVIEERCVLLRPWPRLRVIDGSKNEAPVD